jgi:hypothetical protein
MNTKYFLIGAIVCLALIGTVSAQNTAVVSGHLGNTVSIDVVSNVAGWELTKGSGGLNPYPGAITITTTNDIFQVLKVSGSDGGKMKSSTTPFPTLTDAIHFNALSDAGVTMTGTAQYANDVPIGNGVVNNYDIYQHVSWADAPGTYSETITFILAPS